LKAQKALDAIKGQKTIAELGLEYGVHANQISMWKKPLLDATPAAFSNGKDKDLKKKRLSEIICIKRSANCKSKLIG
jgi:transposase